MKINNETKMQEEYIEILKDIIKNIISNNPELDLQGLEDIKIVNNLENKSSDGKFENNSIFLPKNKMEQYMKNEDFDTIKSTIYHELCHVDLKNKLPQLHVLSDEYRNNEVFYDYGVYRIYFTYNEFKIRNRGKYKKIFKVY